MKRTSSWIVGVIAALAVGPWAQAAPKVHPFEPPPSLAAPAAPGEKLVLGAAVGQRCNPKGSFTRDGDVVSAKLNLVMADFTINNPDPDDPQGGEDPVRLRSYGGCKSGPVLEVKPGDTLRVELNNMLDKNDPTCVDNPPAGLSLPPGVACFNTTNLHTHGLHVSPAGNSDNVLLNIAPQTSFPYEINVPRDHPSGTFWYHAHRHGSTAVQVASGQSGVLLIRGDRPYRAPTKLNPHPIADIDTILHDAKGTPTPEKVFLFQQIAYACFLDDPNAKGGPWQQIFTTKGFYNITNANDPNYTFPPWTCPKSTPTVPVTPGVIENFSLQLDSPTIWDTNGRFTSINGVVQPTITVPAGEIQRWRFIHAGIHDTINVQVVRANPVRNLIQASALTGNRQEQKNDLLAACQATAANLIPQFEIAADGLTRVKVRTVRADTAAKLTESNYLQPGYRSDILVVFPTDGDYCLLDQAAPEQERAGNGSGPGGQGPSTPQLLAYVHVRGGKAVTTDLKAYVLDSLAAANPTLPTKVRDGLRKGDLSPWAPFVGVLAPPSPNNLVPQKADFAISGPPPGASNPLFQINGASYDPDTVNYTRQVNTTDDWLLTSQGEPHIFHIHINPFQVIDITTINPATKKEESIFDKDGKCKPLANQDSQGLANQYCGLKDVYKDTLFVENGYNVHVRTYYDRYIGEYVIHCHILDHEDGGMMANINIVPDLSAPGGGLGMGGMKHNTATGHH